MKKSYIYRQILLLFISMLLLIAGCKPIEEVLQKKVEPIPANGQVPNDAIVYALPRTVLEVQVEFEKVNQKKGPFFNYRKKYLGLEEGISADRLYWQISKVEISSSEEVDPDHYYMVQTNKPLYSNYLHLTKAGLVMSPEPGLSSGKSVNRPEKPAETPLVYFTDISVKRNLDQVNDTAFKLVATDTGFIKVPYVVYKNRLKTGDEKAKEAAEFIIKIRKRRFKLLSGQYDVFPEGTALEYAVNKLNRLEEEYLALFLGKTVKQVYQISYAWIPNTKQSSTELFRFSEKKGLTGKGDRTGEPVILQFKNLSERQLQNMIQPGDSIDTSSLIYRIAAPVSVSISYGKKDLLTDRIMIDQFGTLFRLPNLFVQPSGNR